MEKEAKEKANKRGIRATHHIDRVINEMVKERRNDHHTIEAFHSMDINDDGMNLILFSRIFFTFMSY